MSGFIHLEHHNSELKDDITYFPINGFTSVDLGNEKGNNMFSLITKNGSPQSERYLEIFNDLWHDKDKLKDVTEEVTEYITNVYRENAPEYIILYYSI